MSKTFVQNDKVFKKLKFNMLTSLFLGGVIGAIGKELVNSLFKRCEECFGSSHVVQAILSNRSTQLIELDNYPIVENHSIQTFINTILRDREGGLSILGAPAGSGKSTYVQLAVEKARSDPLFIGDIIILKSKNFLKPGEIQRKIGIDPSTTLTEVLPRYTIIIIDQIDGESLTAEMEEYLLDLTTESRNGKKYSLLLLLSKPVLIDKILRMNGGQKIKEVCDPNHFRLKSKLSAKNYLYKMLEIGNVSEDNIEEIMEICGGYFSPGIAFELRRAIKNRNETFPVEELKKYAFECAMQFKSHWDEYKAVFRKKTFLYSIVADETVPKLNSSMKTTD